MFQFRPAKRLGLVKGYPENSQFSAIPATYPVAIANIDVYIPSDKLLYRRQRAEPCQRRNGLREKLRDGFVKAASPGIYWDTHADAPRGFLLQVTKGGSRAYRLNYRRQHDGVERRITIGDVSAWPIAEARKRGQ